MDRILSAAIVFAIVFALLFAVGLASSAIRRVCEPKLRDLRETHDARYTK